MKTFEAEVRQYLQPNGRVRHEITVLSEDVKPFYDAMITKGWNLSAEILNTGVVSVCIEDRKNERDVAMELIPNGPEVPKALEKMLRETFSCQIQN